MSAKHEKDLAKQFYTVMYRTRRFEEEVFEFYKRGLMPGLAHLYLGEEAIATGACAALREDDYIGSTHRGHGHPVVPGIASAAVADADSCLILHAVLPEWHGPDPAAPR